MILDTSKMKGSPPVVVAHVHVNACQIGSLKRHLVSLDRRLNSVQNISTFYLGCSKQELDKLQTLFLVVLHFRVLLVACVLSNLERV